jgi:acylphosphatase
LDLIQYKIKITGRVQGVGYRHAAMTTARFQGIKGIVKNLSDGSVYIEAEGTRNQLDEYVKWCRTGPGFGSVEGVLVDIAPLKNYKKFNIKY